MADLGTSSGTLERDDHGYDVFLNFRGPDSRDTIVDVLYAALSQAGFRVFLDNEEIRKGEVIKGELLSAIANSKIYIPIFSKDYASSRWCLRELAKMIECWENSSGKKVILPVFYQVDISEDIKLKSDAYSTILQVHRTELGDAAVEPWEAALKKVTKISGWNLKDYGLLQLVDLIKEKVFSILNASETIPIVPDGLIGIHEQIEPIVPLLGEGSLDVRFIVIHGMGGIGKTTLAKSIFKKISSHFLGSCILFNIRQSSSDAEMVKLQEKLLSDTLKLKSIIVSDIDDGIFMISKRLCNQKVLIVLDDLDKRDDLKKLAAKSDWFGPRSRIIITTRNIDFLPTKDKYHFYEMKNMDRGHALQLFCRHAFESDSPPPKYYDISTEIVATTGGLPLAIKVIGSLLYNQNDGTWKFRLEKLKKAPHKDVQETLMISYQALEYEQQQIFLDIACFFNEKKKTDAIYFWKACKFYPSSGIEILIRQSLIKVNGHGKLWMHDQLRDLGRAIAQPKSQDLKIQISTKPSRLWSSKVALDAVRKKEVTKSVVALNLETLDANCSFSREEFTGFINLKFLQLKGGNFEGDFENVFQQLRWLYWSNCPMKIEATNLSFKNLVVLKLSIHEITEDWGGWGPIMVAKQLKVLNLTCYKGPTKTPDFSTLLGLERLIINNYQGLKEIDSSIAKLKHLDYLEISGGLTKLHPSIGELGNLKHLRLQCPQLKNIPSSIGELALLEVLDVSESRIKELPDSIGDLKRLKILRMTGCPISSLPNSIGRLESLNELKLQRTKIRRLPITIESLKSLKVVDLWESNVEVLSEELGELVNLEELYASRQTKADGEIIYLGHLNEIGKLSRLRILQLSFSDIYGVPTTINQISQLSHLQKLDLSTLYDPPELLKFPLSLTSLCLSIFSITSYKVPDLSYLTNLVNLKLVYVSQFKTPKTKWVVEPDLILPSTQLSSLSRLQKLDITCSHPQSLTRLPSSLERLTLHDVKSPSKWQLFSTLNNLSTLEFSRCFYKEIQIDGLGKLKNLHLRALRLSSCRFVKVSNLSCLKELRSLSIGVCSRLVDIQDLGQVESLQYLRMWNCPSIQRLPDLSGLKKLEALEFRDCALESMPNINEETSCCLRVRGCYHFDDYRGPYTKLKRKTR